VDFIGDAVGSPEKKLMVKSSGLGAEDDAAPPLFKILPGATKATRNCGEPWAPEDIRELRAFTKQMISTRQISIRLGRTEASIRGKILREGITPAPRNRKLG
jgi:hypothetical protein